MNGTMKQGIDTSVLPADGSDDYMSYNFLECCSIEQLRFVRRLARNICYDITWWQLKAQEVASGTWSGVIR